MTDVDERAASKSAAEHGDFAEMIEAFRELRDALCTVNPPADQLADATDTLRLMTARLREFAAPEGSRPARRDGVPDRFVTHPVLVPYTSVRTGETMTGSVEFTIAHLGGVGVHGGVVTMMFDDVLGTFVAECGQPDCVTAYLKVDYRSPTPIERKLRLTGRIDRIDGRKVVVSGEIRDGESVCAQAEALFLRVRQGQR
ncbi:PaaI family thioesterase [Gordonia alkanivorans]|uniref:PaaI family thioesterase n=1 Tax=Gordonia alkanivorans TaxID=84096 RepID=UPI00244C8C62|nr:hotdog domain-containing protein [Gordonia alkanivorans]MDH3047304.1 hotdog domain-containing protein [Gordonia alkanivorans]